MMTEVDHTTSIVYPDEVDEASLSARPSAAEEVWHLTIAYNGTNYAGWQIQPGARTVQGALQDRLRRLLHQENLVVAGTSRTDAGVHALDQHATFTIEGRDGTTPEQLQERLNRWLPGDIRILAVQRAPADFHARYSARGKAYTYAVNTSLLHSPFDLHFVWNIRRSLNLDNMHKAAAELVGRHDFRAFSANPRRTLESTVRNLWRLDIQAQGAYLYFTVIGDGFLYKMVRSVVGYIVKEAGLRRNWQAAEVGRILASRERPACVNTAPAQGLFLDRVFFQDNEWLEYQPQFPPFLMGTAEC